MTLSTAYWRPKRARNPPICDGLRFLLITFKIATLYSPLKLFAPTGFVFLLGLMSEQVIGLSYRRDA